MIYNLLTLNSQTQKKYNAVAIGNFDGFHLGHQKVISSLLKSGDSNLVIILKKNLKEEITTIEQRSMMIQEIDKNLDILVITLTESIMNVSKDEFISFLRSLEVKNVYVGSDFYFGKNKEGNIHTLQDSFNVNIVQMEKNNESKISSSTIKGLILNGDVSKANELLGHRFSIKGKTIKGKQLGRTIGFPTFNIISNKIIPKNGVYETRTVINGKEYKSITNVGVRPTVGNDDIISIETNILNTDFGKENYGLEIEVIFIELIRDEIKFDSVDKLKKQIQQDINGIK